MPSPREFLLFRLWGPMSSWGSIAVGEQRQTWTRPSRSAVLGIVAAALGIERADARSHAPLEAGLGFAVRVDRVASPLRDYHTAQSPSSEAKRRWRSRHDEIHGAKTLNTILSERHYHTEQSATIALWRRDTAPAELATLAVAAEKLRRPTFTLYLGRKASPLGLPPDPQLFTAVDLSAAFADFDARHAASVKRAESDLPRLAAVLARLTDTTPATGASIWLDPRDLPDVAAGMTPREHTQRRDGVRDRRTWTFEDRAEVEIKLGATP